MTTALATPEKAVRMASPWSGAVRSIREHDGAAQSIWRFPRVDVLTFCRDFLGRKHSPPQEEALAAIWGEDPAIFWPITNRLIALCWGMGCLHPDTPLRDAETGDIRSVAEWSQREEGPVLSGYDESGSIVTRRASVPWLKGRERLYRVTLADGRTCSVTAKHRFLVREAGGELKLKRLQEIDKGDAICVEGHCGKTA